VVNGWTFLSAEQPTVAVVDIRENGWFLVSSLQLVGFEKLSPLASTFLLLRQKKGTKEKATPDRSKARNKINRLRQRRNSAAASVGGLRHPAF
jgi:hypothetical protein